MFGEFVLLDGSAAAAKCAGRLRLGDTQGRDEAWLRDRLFAHPELLPIGDLDPSFGPLLPLCRELRTEAGPVDVSFINTSGRITLVECKLWKNPEARRKVVAQILDYARALVRWSYSDLQRQVAMALGRQGNIPFELARTANPSLVEHQFADAVTRSLRAGRFLLVVAGDGIREDMAALAELINRNAALGFSFGLVELALYDLGDGGLAMQPRVPMRAHVIERHVVVLPGGDTLVDEEQRPPDLDLGSPREGDSEAGSVKHAMYRDWWQPVVDMSFDDPDQEPPRLHWPNNVRVHLPYPRVWITAYHSIVAGGTSGVSLGGKTAELERLLELLEPVDGVVAELPEGTAFRKAFGRLSFYTLISNSAFATDDACRDWLKASLNTYVNVLRPRVKQLVPDN